MIGLLKPPGARGRIGVIQPAPGVMIEYEWPKWLPSDVLFPVGRMRMPSADRAGYAEMAAVAPAVAQDLASAGAGVIAYACTLGSIYAGAKAEADLTAALAAASGKPAISLGEASIEALRQLGARRLLIMTPYSKEINTWVADYALEAGFDVLATLGTPVGIAEIGEYGPAAIHKLSVEALSAHPRADALWLPCTAIQTLEAIDAVETDSGRCVVSGSQALLWGALRLLKLAGSGPGRLFA